MQLALFDENTEGASVDFSLEEVFEAYYRCRQNKRNTANALAFEIDLEENLIQSSQKQLLRGNSKTQYRCTGPQAIKR